MIWTTREQSSKSILRGESCNFRGASALITLHEQSDPSSTDAFAVVLSIDHEEVSVVHRIPDVKPLHTEEVFSAVKRRLEQVMSTLPDKDDLEAELKLERFVDKVFDLQYIGYIG